MIGQLEPHGCGETLCKLDWHVFHIHLYPRKVPREEEIVSGPPCLEALLIEVLQDLEGRVNFHQGIAFALDAPCGALDLEVLVDVLDMVLVESPTSGESSYQVDQFLGSLRFLRGELESQLDRSEEQVVGAIGLMVRLLFLLESDD